MEFFSKFSLRRQNLLFSSILDAFRFVYEEKLTVFTQIIVIFKQILKFLLKLKENTLKTLPNSPIHAFMEKMFAKYQQNSKCEGSKQINLSTISFENRGSYFLNDFLLDNVEEESAVRDRELKKTAASHHIKSSTGEENRGTTNKIVDYEEEEEDLEKRELLLNFFDIFFEIFIYFVNHFIYFAKILFSGAQKKKIRRKWQL